MTDRLQAEELLQWDTPLFKLFIDTAVDGILVIDEIGTLLVFNNACERLFGFARGEVVGQNIKVLMPLPHRDEHDDYIRRYKETGRRHIIGIGRETQGQRKDGTVFPIHVTVGEGFYQGSRIFVGIIRDLTARDRERDEFERQKAYLGLVVESSTDAIIACAQDGTVTGWNASAERMYGHRAADVVGKPVWPYLERALPPGRIAQEQAIHATVAGGGTITPYQTVRMKDGRPLHVMVTVSPICDASGAIIGVSRIVRDISEHLAYQQERSLLSAVVESSQDAIYTKTLDGVITSCNKAAEELFGYPAEEIIGQPMLILVPPDRVAEEEAILVGLKAGEVIRHYETVRLRKDGKQINVSVTVSPIRDSSGVVVGASKIVRDITERKKSEAELQASKAKLEAAFAAMSEAVFIADRDGNIIHFNEAFALFHKFRSVAECANRLSDLEHVVEVFDSAGDFIAPERWPAARALRGETVAPAEYMLRRVDTGESWFGSCTFVPIFDGDGTVIGSVGVGRDITQSKADADRIQALRNQLSHVARINEMTQISAGIAHELNQPLAAIVNYTSVAKRHAENGDVPDIAKAAEAIAKAGEQALRAGQIIRRLRDFMERREINRTLQDINAIAEDAMALGLIGANSANITTHVQLGENIRPVLADRVQIEQVLVNLLRNAIEAMAASDKRELTISTAAIGDQAVEVTVTDTGPGIAQELQERLFMPFVTTKPGGMGIGLAISRSIVEAHGGELVAVPNPGCGTTFRFTLPAVPEGKQTAS